MRQRGGKWNQQGSTLLMSRTRTASPTRSRRSSSTLRCRGRGSLRSTRGRKRSHISLGCRSQCKMSIRRRRCTSRRGSTCTRKLRRPSNGPRGSTRCTPNWRSGQCRSGRLGRCSRCSSHWGSTFQQGTRTAWLRRSRCRGSSTLHCSSCRSASSTLMSTGPLGNGKGWTCTWTGNSIPASSQCSTASVRPSNTQRCSRSSSRMSSGGSCTAGIARRGNWHSRSRRSSIALRAVSWSGIFR